LASGDKKKPHPPHENFGILDGTKHTHKKFLYFAFHHSKVVGILHFVFHGETKHSQYLEDWTKDVEVVLFLDSCVFICPKFSHMTILMRQRVQNNANDCYLLLSSKTFFPIGFWMELLSYISW
jgi:hypothetical protein